MDKTVCRRWLTVALVLAAALAGVQARPTAAAAPVAAHDSYEITPNTSLAIAAPGVLGNDGDADGDPLSAVLFSPPVTGTLTLAADGAILYVPMPGFNGVDWFGYQASDGTELSDFRNVYILVNTTPTATDDAYIIPADTPLVVPAPGVVGNDFDPDGGPLTTVLSFGATFGTLTFSKAGSFTYTPDPGFEGVDVFGYQPSDGFVYGGTAYVTITVGFPPKPPFAAADVFTFQQGTPNSVPAPGVLANDYDGNGDPMFAQVVTPPAHGTLVLGGDGGFHYAPDPAFAGIDSFTYWAADDVQFGNVATVTLVVEAAPGATGDGDRGSDSADCPDSRQPDATTSQDCR